MTKATQRVLSLLLAAVLLFGMFPMSALAAETEQTGIAAPEADVTDPPEAAESETVESVGDDTIPTEETQVETVTMETTVPTTEPEVTHGEDTQPVETVPETTHGEEVTEPAETVPETLPTETVPETMPAVTEPEETQPEVTEPAVTETGDPLPEITVDTPIIDHGDLILNGAGSEITPYAANDSVCRVLGRIYTNVQEYDPVNHIENGIIRYEFPAGTPKARSFVELHTLKLNGAWKTAYCMEPGEPTVPAGSNYNSKVYTMDELLNSGLISNKLTDQQVYAMGLVSLYGQQTFPDSYKTTTGKAAIGRMTATQILIWEIAIGWRSSSEPYSLLNDSFMRRFKDKNQGIGCIMNYSQYWSMGSDLAYITNIRTAYNEIAAKVEKHFTIPSFTNRYQSAAPIIYLEPDGKGNYTATVTDTNNILSEYTLPTMDGVTFTKDGNKLTITTKNKFDAKLVAPTKTVPNFEEQTYYYWYSGSYQTLISCAAEPSYDPVPAYFKIQSKEREGKIEVNKNDPNGKKLDGAYFVATNQETGEKYTIGPTVNGYASKDHIPYGSYEIEETVFPKGYTTSGTSKWTKTLNESTPNATITINAVNKLITGTGKIIKRSTNGGTVEGWWFYIWNNKWEWVGRFKTGADGTFSHSLVPGTYIVREVPLSAYEREGLTLPNGVDPQYWVQDTTDKNLTITANETATVTYNNKFYGKIMVQKATNTGGNLEGWKFNIINSSGTVVETVTTNSSGVATSKNLDPGKYTVKEVGHESMTAAQLGYWVMAESKVITVEAGKTASESFTNKNYGKIMVQKATNTGGDLAGWVFEVKDAAGTVVATITTGEDGRAATDLLAPGTYTITEVDGPDGLFDSADWFCDISETNGVVKVKANETTTHNVKNIKGGRIKVQKHTNTGEYLDGWLFEVKNSNGEVVATLETNENGVAETIALPHGEYTVTEVGNNQSWYNPDYWINDPVPERSVKIDADTYVEYKTVEYTNRFVSQVEIIKETNTDTAADYEGWVFGVYTDAECTAENRVAELITASIVDEVSGTVTGKSSLILDPGTYYIKEEGRADGSTTDGNGYSWIMDTHVEEVILVGGEKATVSFRNEKYGVGQIVKVAENGSPADWTFEVWSVTEDGNKYIGEYVTTEDGTVAVNLLPGEYIVQEKIPETPDPYWVYDTQSRTVTIEAGKTTEIGPFVNTQLGRGRIIKETNTGNNLGGWIFGIYSSPTCDESSLITTVTTADEDNAESGDIYGQTVFYLDPGTYYVKEIGFVDGKYDGEKWELDTTIKEVVITAGEEAVAVRFTNSVLGDVAIAKKSTNGGSVVGWQFSVVGVDNDFSEIITITEELDGAGIISVSLDPGTYIITEIGHNDPTLDMTYWELDTEPRTVTVEGEKTVSVEYMNHFKGELIVQKSLEDPTSGVVKGWQFKVEKLNEDGSVESSFMATTDEDGLISSIVEPGTYRITEILDDESPWTVVGENPKIVNVVAGQPNTVQFVNRLGEGKITIYKVNPTNEALSGATFLLEWSEDGKEWKSVVRSETVTRGGCTSEGLENGKLTTGEDGVIVFAGLHPGVQYRVTETKAPDGYLLLADYVFVGQLPTDALEVYKTVTNNPEFGNPPTGVFGTTETFAGMMLAIMTMAMFAFAALFVLNGKAAVQKNNYTKGSNPMKKKNRILSLLLALCLTIGMAVPAFAATAENATINPDALGSIELYKYDMTAATEEGLFRPDSFVSTGTPNEEAEEVLSPYAIEGVVFSYHKIADIITCSEVNALTIDEYTVKNLYAMPIGAQTDDLLAAINLDPVHAYPLHDGEEGYIYFTSDVLSDALRTALANNSSYVKDKLMQFNTAYNSPMFAETDETGHTKVENLDLGLYLIVETYVPEQVKITTAPFLVSVPSTTNDGAEWNYDLTFYPKNETDSPDLTKEVRESKADTGKNDGGEHGDNNGFQHTATGSAGDVMEYRITSTLPTISSDATNLTKYSFLDTLSKGIEYNRNDVVVEWFKDADCYELIATWTETDETAKFTVTYGTAENDATTMLIEMTEAGLAEINGSDAVYDSFSIYDGYSDCTVRITYAATVNSNADVVVGNEGNPNEVELTWSRTNTRFEDTLDDCCHVYTYGIDLTKKFDDELGNFANVNFVVKNTTDNYWVVAELDTTAGIYYVTDHVENEEDATVFVPTEDGSVCVIGLEDDIYTITETKTDAGYVLLRDAITVEITASDEGEFNGICSKCGAKLVVATATINGKQANIVPHEGSENAVVVLTVVNNSGYDQPATGDEGTVMLTVCGTMFVVSSICLGLLVAFRPKKKENQ